MKTVLYAVTLAMLSGALLLSYYYVEAVGIDKAALWFGFWLSGFAFGYIARDYQGRRK